MEHTLKSANHVRCLITPHDLAALDLSTIGTATKSGASIVINMAIREISTFYIFPNDECHISIDTDMVLDRVFIDFVTKDPFIVREVPEPAQILPSEYVYARFTSLNDAARFCNECANCLVVQSCFYKNKNGYTLQMLVQRENEELYRKFIVKAVDYAKIIYEPHNPGEIIIEENAVQKLAQMVSL